MIKEIKILFDIVKKYYLLIFIPPLLISAIIYFFILNYYSEKVELQRYHIYTSTVNRQETFEVEKIISKLRNTNSSYNNPYQINEKIINSIEKKETIIIGETFREFIDILISDDKMMKGISRFDLSVNDLNRNQFFNIDFSMEDLKRLKIDFHSYNKDEKLIYTAFDNAINFINSIYSNKIFEVKKEIFLQIKEDSELAIKMNDDLINTKTKQFLYKDEDISLKNYINQKKVDLQLEIIFLKGYKNRLIDIISDIDGFIFSKENQEIKLFNSVSEVINVSETKFNFIIKYLYIISYFLFSFLFLVLIIIYEYNFKRKK